MPTCVLNGRIAIHIRQQAQTESVIAAWVRVAIDNNARRRRVEHFTDAVV